MKKLLILAIIIRLLISAFYFHPDIKTYHFQSSFLKHGVFNIYSYLVQNKSSLPFKEEFVYFPLTYFVLGGYQAVVSPLLGNNFDSWLANASSNSFVRDPEAFKYLLVLKLPYLMLDLAIAFIIKKFFDDKKKADMAATIWLFNPFTIILIYVFGNIDIIPVTITLLSVLLMKSRKLLLASVALGLAAGFKLYPLLFVPFLALKGRDPKEKLVLAALPIGIFALISAPFVSQEFIDSALVSGLSTRIFNPGFSIGFNESIIVSLLGISLLLFYAYLIDKNINLFNYWITLFLIIFSFSHFHIQWLLWIAPFLVILGVKKPLVAKPIFLLTAVAFAIPLLYEDRYMNISLLRLYSTAYDLLPTPFSVLQRFYDPYSLQSILHSLLAAGNLILTYKLFRERKASS